MDTVGPVLQAVLTAADLALQECSRPVSLVTLSPGSSVVWDDCCNGEVWVRLISMTPNTPSPGTPLSDVTVTAAVGVVRCLHGMEDDGSPPTASEMTEDTLGQLADADALLAALVDLVPGPNTRNLTVTSGLPLGPQGYCGGFEWTFTFRQLLCLGC